MRATRATSAAPTTRVTRAHPASTRPRRIGFTGTLVGLCSVGLVLAGSTACATKGFVNTRIGEVTTKVDRVGREVGEVSESLAETRTKADRNTAQLAEVDRTAVTALNAADAATEAIDDVAATGAETRDQVEAIAADSRRLLFEVVITEAQGEFKFADATLPAPAQQQLDALVERLKTYPKGVYLEIEGHTDATGPERFNERLGLNRAESVVRYLHEAHQVPLHKMNCISYGEMKPIAPNNTRQGRAENRRVVIRVLA